MCIYNSFKFKLYYNSYFKYKTLNYVYSSYQCYIKFTVFRNVNVLLKGNKRIKVQIIWNKTKLNIIFI